MKVKICGMRDLQNLNDVVRLSPDYLGFIFYPKSPRCVNQNIAESVAKITIPKMGVFVNEEIAKITEIVEAFQLDGIQLHGDESPEQCKKIQKLFPKLLIWKAFGIHREFSWHKLSDYVCFCSHFLFDTKTKGYGGSGTSFDWGVLQNYSLSHPFILSGGIGLGNIRKALEYLNNFPNVHGIDINSKAEISPGVKSPEIVRDILQEVTNGLHG